MVSGTRDAWKEVGSRAEALGLKLKLHLDQEVDEDVPERDEGDTQNAFEELADQVSDAFEAFGNAVRDEAVHADVRSIADAIKGALAETFRTVGAEVGDFIEQIEDKAEGAADKVAAAVKRDHGNAGGDVIETDVIEAVVVEVSEEE